MSPVAEIFDPPNWPGGPPMCVQEYRPAFETWDKAREFHEANAPGALIRKKWQCRFCGCWHYIPADRPPSGDSSGISRR